MNKLLQRQMRKHIGDREIPDEFRNLLQTVSESYEHNERDRRLLERSVEISSMELRELNAKLRLKTEKENLAVYHKLKESLLLLNQTEKIVPEDLDFRKLAQLADILKKETRKRRLAEEERSQRAKHLEASQKIAHVGSWELDVSDPDQPEFLYWSDETYRIFGYEPEDGMITAEMYYSCISPTDLKEVRQALKAALESGEIYDHEYRIKTKTGEEKFIHECAELSISEHGASAKMIGTVQDVTARRKSKLALEEANHELRTLFDNMQETAFTIDMVNQRLTQISPSCKDIYGYTVKEFLQNSNLWLEVMHDEDRPQILAKRSQLEKGESVISAYRIKDKKGKTKWLQTKVKPTIIRRQLVRIDGVTSDITKQRKAEEELRKSEHWFRSLIQNSADAVLVANKGSKTTFVSTSFSKIMGYHPAEVFGKSCYSFFHPDDFKTIKEHIRGIQDDYGKTHSIEFRARKKDGSYIYCGGSTTNLIKDPAVRGVVVNFRDVTEEKEYERALTASNKELRKSNGELDKFVYSVSHDLRAPLASILGLISLMESQVAQEQIGHDIALIKQSVLKLDGFIGDILDYSRNARVELEPQVICFEDKIQEIVRNLAHMTIQDISMNIQVEADHAFASDPARLSVVLNNLISNAIRYMDGESNSPELTVKVKTDKENCVIEVIDNGIGIAPEHLKSIFDMFYRVSNKSTGSGLGLYIVKETVEKLNGKVEVSSQLMKGTSFKICLPNLASC